MIGEIALTLETDPAPNDGSWWPILAAVLLVLAAALAYANTFSCPFVLDDHQSIPDNPTIRRPGDLGQILSPPGTRTTVSGRPIVNLTLAVNYAVSGTRVGSYHAANLLIHVAAALVLFGLVRRTLRLPGVGRSDTEATGLAFTAALIWALHPLQTSAVTYIAQRAESLMALLYLLTLTCVVKGASARRAWLWYGAAVIACALGTATKEVTVTAPLVVLLYDRAFLAGSWRAALRKRWALYLALAATWAILLALLMPRHGSIHPLRYAATQPGVILHYLRLTVWPDRLIFWHDWPFAESVGDVLLPALLLAPLLAGMIWALWRRPKIGFLAASFFVVLAPTSTIVPIDDAMFEHRMYLPLAFLAVLGVLGLWWLWQRVQSRSAAMTKAPAAWLPTITLIALAIALGTRTIVRNRDYRSAEHLWRQVLDAYPNHAKAWNNLGRHYLTAGNPAGALDACNKAVELEPQFPIAYLNRAVAKRALDRTDDALADVAEAIRCDEGYAQAYRVRGDIYRLRGFPNPPRKDLEQAVNAYCTANDLEPRIADSWLGLALCYLQLERLDDGVDAATRAIGLQGQYGEAYYVRGLCYQQLRRHDEAVADLSRAVELMPNDARPYGYRAVSQFNLQRIEQAWEDARRCNSLGGQVPGDLMLQLQRAGAR